MIPGPGMGPYRPRVELALKYSNLSQSKIGRSVGLGIYFHTVRESINPGAIPVFVPGLSELYICGWIIILGMGPIVPR